MTKSIATILFCLFFLTACDKPEQKAAKHIERGNVLFEKEQFAKARLEYKNAGKFAPTDPSIYYYLGRVDEAEGNFQYAFQAFTRAEQQDPNYAPALLKLAQYYMAGNQFEESRKRLNTVFANDPDNAEGHALLAGVLLREKDYEGTLKEAQLALKKDPANVTAIAVLTGLYKAQGDDAKAAETVESGIRNNPKDISLLLLKATLYEKANNAAKVVEAYDAIFKLKPNDTGYRMALVSFYIRTEMKDQAEALLRQTVVSFPEQWNIKRALVDFLGKERGLESAEKEITAYLDKNPDHNEPYFWLADLYIKNKDIERATKLLEKIAANSKQTPDSLNATASLARLHIAKGDKALAQKLVSAVLEKNAGHPDALFLRANLLFDEGAYQAAVADLRSIIRDNPKTKNAYQLLSEVLLLQGHLDLATDTLKSLLEKHPDDIPSRVRLAQMLNAGGNPKFGLEHLAVVTKTSPDYVIGWESTARLAISAKNDALADTAIKKLASFDGHANTATFLNGMKLDANGQTEKALAEYKTVISKAPGTPLAEHALTAVVSRFEKDKRYQDIADYISSLPHRSAYALNMMGEAYIMIGKTDDAATAFENAIAQGTNSPKPYLNRAGLWAKNKQYNKAIEVLENGIKAIPADYHMPIMMAGLYGQLKAYDKAITTYESVLTRNPEINIAANNLAQVIADYRYDDKAALEKARILAERFISASNPLLLDTLAWVYYRQGKIEQALTIMDRAMAFKDAPLPAQMHYHYGALLAKRGDKTRAKEHLEKAVSSVENFDGKDEAKAMLDGVK